MTAWAAAAVVEAEEGVERPPPQTGIAAPQPFCPVSRKAAVTADMVAGLSLTHNRLEARKDSAAQQRIIDSLNGTYGMSASTPPAFAPANLTTLAHFAVSFECLLALAIGIQLRHVVVAWSVRGQQ